MLIGGLIFAAAFDDWLQNFLVSADPRSAS
jgi:hypothetical protein